MPLLLALTGAASAWLLLPLLTLPLAVALVRQVMGGLAGRDLNAVLRRTGQLEMAFGVLLAAGLLL